MADLVALKTEIDTDPLTRGYAGMTDQQVADSLNTVDRTLPRPTMTASEVINAMNKAEFNALTNNNKQLVWDLLHLGVLNPFGIEAGLFVDIFGGGSATITALQAARTTAVSRAEEIGVGSVNQGDVNLARSI